MIKIMPIPCEKSDLKCQWFKEIDNLFEKGKSCTGLKKINSPKNH